MSDADWTTITGRIVEASFVRSGDAPYECGLDDCECPEHEYPPRRAGTYVTVRLSEDVPVGLGDVTVTRIANVEATP